MKNKGVNTILLVLVALSGLLYSGSQASAQEIGPGMYWIYFTDKNGNGYDLARA